MKRTFLASFQAAVLILVALGLSSCTEKIRQVLVLPNDRPVVRITAAPIDSTETCDPDPVRSCYSLTISWSGYDSDGRVDHYLYAIDPPGPTPECPNISATDTCWLSTRENERRVRFSAGTVINSLFARDFHTFVIKAVDDRGLVGPSVARAFFSFTEAPTVQITNPTPFPLLPANLTPSVRFVWSGDDPDGVFTDKPVKYKYLLLSQSSEFPMEIAISNPDSLRRYYAPHFFGWDSTSADTTEVQFTSLTPGQNYVFVVIAIDEAGAYSPVFSLNSNMIRFRVGFAGNLGPKITVFNEFFDYSYPGGYCSCPQAEVFVEVPAQTPVVFNWFAIPPEGANMKSYRWALDIADVSDDTPRTDDSDLAHWSQASLTTTAVRFPGFPGGFGDEPEIHRLYIEAEDNVQLRSLAIIRFEVVKASLAEPLGIVDDTRFTVDKLLVDRSCTDRPKGSWPMAAELDTFFYAVGGAPYKCYPAGTLSSPGLFHGYTFDTVGTRLVRRDLSIRLSTLGRFAHLIWMIDGLGATFNRIGTDPFEPQTSLRYMTSPGRFNALGAYVKQGGKLWLQGGGAAMGSQIAWDDQANNVPTVVFAASSPRRELVSGRVMFDLAGWQSEIRVTKVVPRIRRFAGRLESAPDPAWPYTNFLSELPELLETKTAATDPLPPQRAIPGEFYQNTINLEFLQLENRVVEVVSETPFVEMSTLDTLYDATGNGLPVVPRDNRSNVVMSFYHPTNIPQGVLFSGFALWVLKRPQAEKLIDFVLQRMWGLSRSAQPTRMHRAEYRSGVTPAPAISRAVDYGRSTRGAPSGRQRIVAPVTRDN